MVCCGSSSPPHTSSAPGICSRRDVCSSMLAVVCVSTGPTVRSSRRRRAASSAMRLSMSAASQRSCTNSSDCAEHFWPDAAYASWSHCAATYSTSPTSGPSIFQSKPASSMRTLPRSSVARWSATRDEPVNCVRRTGAVVSSASVVAPDACSRSTSPSGAPHACMSRSHCSSTIDVRSAPLTTTLLPAYSAPMSCSTGISSGKLNGHTMATAPYGQR
mmetsp:Transcript_49611/g.121823  ORF Transcript_49611/g.121823 Transcript_49611/m.121823 type:complete len:217 (-) Transcript_49611:165-815(-)